VFLFFSFVYLIHVARFEKISGIWCGVNLCVKLSECVCVGLLCGVISFVSLFL